MAYRDRGEKVLMDALYHSENRERRLKQMKANREIKKFAADLVADLHFQGLPYMSAHVEKTINGLLESRRRNVRRIA